MDRNLSFYALFYVGSLVLMRLCGIITKIILARAITPFEYGIIMLIVITLPAIFQLGTNFCFLIFWVMPVKDENILVFH